MRRGYRPLWLRARYPPAVMDIDSMLAAPLAGRVVGAVDGDFVIAEWKDEGVTSRERAIAPLHLHRTADEAWYVLEGALGVRLGDEEVECPAGGCVVAPAGTPHSYWNATGGRTRYLLVMTPDTRRLIQELHELPSGRTLDDIRALFRRHDSELLV
jgi:mannose-6-phosphate isomerase-like protein (cupin superfamily)